MIHDEDEYPDHESLSCQKERIDEEEWDTLVVFDACRWDALNELLDRNVEKLRTPTTSSTAGWMKHIWNRKKWNNVSYISTNPMTDWVQSEKSEADGYYFDLESKFKNYVRAWEESERYRPNAPTKIAKQYTPPRIIHYMQPHTPYLGRITLDIVNRDKIYGNIHSKHELELAEDGHISPELIRSAYFENLKLAWRYAKDFRTTNGKVVYTADHGEVLGPDRFTHGSAQHSQGRVVPWVEYG